MYISSLSQPLPIFGPPSPKYNPLNPARRKSRVVVGIGGDNPPVVVSCDVIAAPDAIHNRAHLNSSFFSDATPHNPDWIFFFRHFHSKYGKFPCFSFEDIEDVNRSDAEAKFIFLSFMELTDSVIRLLKTDKCTIAVFVSACSHYIGEARVFMHRLLDADCDVPVIFMRSYEDKDPTTVRIQAAIEYGTLLTDGFGDGLFMQHTNNLFFNAEMRIDCMFGILQATRLRISKTEYISCPGCGRTLFDLQKAIMDVKAATAHLKGLKIAIMGCIVNGPGEMADADYGYVGAGRGRVSLYKGKTCILKNIPEEDAVASLINLIEMSPTI
jgi:(E)-4-hydroxy-3-methylbut-2-enyl-diphosphate synthase